MISSTNSTLHLTIDGIPVETEKGMTILTAATQNQIYIPTLCAHKDLTPFGACRVCIVEVKGRNNYPSACTTPAEEGMEVFTALNGFLVPPPISKITWRNVVPNGTSINPVRITFPARENVLVPLFP